MTFSAVLEWCALNAPVTFARTGAPGDVAAAEFLTETVWTNDLRSLFSQANGCRGLLPWLELFTLDEIIATRAMQLELAQPEPDDGERYDGFTEQELGGWDVFDVDNAAPGETHESNDFEVDIDSDTRAALMQLFSPAPTTKQEALLDQAARQRALGGYPGKNSESVDLEAGSPLTGDFSPLFIPFAGLDGNCLFVDLRRGPQHGCVTEWDEVDAAYDSPRWASVDAMFVELLAALRSGDEFEGHVPSVVRGELVWV